MPQPQTRHFPGYGIVYPDGNTGIKIIGTFTEAPKKVFNPDGSTSYESPSPTIYELFGGGFCYAGGGPITNREHLENISDIKMKERALQWYDTHGKVISPLEVVPREEDKERPEPAYILSNQVSGEQNPGLEDPVVAHLNETIAKNAPFFQEMFMKIASKVLGEKIENMTELIKKQGEEIAQLKTSTIPHEPKRRGTVQSQKMKERWADPAFREKRMKNKKVEEETNIPKEE